MIRSTRRFVSALTVAALVAFSATPSSAAMSTSSNGSSTSVAQNEHDADPSPPLFDMMVMRPLGLGVLAAGTLLMLPVGAIMLMIRPADIKLPYELLMKEPAQFVFVDPMGSH